MFDGLDMIIPRNLLFSAAIAAAASVLAASPARACLPPPPDMPIPPRPDREELLRTAIHGSTDVVSGRVLSTSRKDGRVRFRVEHVYKGRLRPGAVVTAWQGWGMDPPMCPGMIPPPPLPNGTRGTVYFSGDPLLNFLYDADLERAFATGLLQRAKRPRR